MHKSWPSVISARRGSSSWPSGEKASGKKLVVNTLVSSPSEILSRNSFNMISELLAGGYPWLSIDGRPKQRNDKLRTCRTRRKIFFRGPNLAKQVKER